MANRNPCENLNHVALPGGVTGLPGALPGDADCQKMFSERESVFKRLTHPQGSYAASAMGNLLVTKDILVQETSPMHPVRIGDFFSITVPDEFYVRQLGKFRFALIGRVLLNKGTAPVPVVHLKPILGERWKILDDWNLIALGRGFYTFQFSTERDQRRVASVPVWNFGGGSLRIREWTPGFDPFKLKLTAVPVWVRIYNLPYEFWHPDLITGIGKAIGNPLKIDGKTASGDFGHFARILVDVDFQNPLQEFVMIDRGEKSFFVELYYENIPTFCGSCKQLGHETSKCRNIPPIQGDAGSADKRKLVRTTGGKENSFKEVTPANSGEARALETNGDVQREPTKIWVARSFGEKAKLETPKQCVSSDLAISPNRFAALAQDEDKNEDEGDESSKDIEEETINETPKSDGLVVADSIDKVAIPEHDPKNVEMHTAINSGDISETASEDFLGNVQTPFVTKRRARHRKRSVTLDLPQHHFLSDKDGRCEFSPQAIALHNMNVVAKGNLDAIINFETWLSPGASQTAIVIGSPVEGDPSL